jgi:hypothetical protein
MTYFLDDGRMHKPGRDPVPRRSAVHSSNAKDNERTLSVSVSNPYTCTTTASVFLNFGARAESRGDGTGKKSSSSIILFFGTKVSYPIIVTSGPYNFIFWPQRLVQVYEGARGRVCQKKVYGKVHF